ncbi:MAG: phytoene desaturase family protein [Pseudomonadota bacterium]
MLQRLRSRSTKPGVEGSGPRIAIVGAGPGGLAAAMMLSAEGARVTLYEKGSAVGGRTKVVTLEGGYKFDIGPTFFLYPQVLREVFERCGLDMDGFIELARVDPQYRLDFGDGTGISATPDLEAMAAEIAKINEKDAASLQRFMEDNRAKLAAFGPILKSAFSGVSDVLKMEMLPALRWLRPTQSVNDDLARYFEDERVRLTFSFQTKYLGMSPFRCPSLFTILSFLEYEYGVWHPIGGCGAVSEAMSEAAQTLGAEVRLDADVTGIAFEGKRAVGVRIGDAVEPADAVIVGADFAGTVPQLVPNGLRKRWTDAKIDKAKFSCSTVMLYLGIEGDYPHLDHHTIFLAEDYKANIQEIEEGFGPPSDPSVYVQNPAKTDPSFRTEAGVSLYVLAPVGNLKGGADWEASKAAFREQILDKLEARGLTDLRARIRTERMMTPEDWQDEYGLYAGATFNLAHGLDQMLMLRPRNRFEDVDGVYLVGGGTHPGSGLPVIYEGARITADLLMKDLGLARPVTQGGPMMLEAGE